MSLKIQVLGKGLIPRGYGLAPRKEPFPAELNLIQVILATPGLSIKYVKPEDNTLATLDKTNVMRIWNKYHEGGKKPVYNSKVTAAATTAPSTPAPKKAPAPAPAPVPPVNNPVVNTTPVNTNPTPEVVNTAPVNTNPTTPVPVNVDHKKEEDKSTTDEKTESTKDDVFKPVVPDEEKDEKDNTSNTSNNNNNNNRHNNNKHK